MIGLGWTAVQKRRLIFKTLIYNTFAKIVRVVGPTSFYIWSKNVNIKWIRLQKTLLSVMERIVALKWN